MRHRPQNRARRCCVPVALHARGCAACNSGMSGGTAWSHQAAGRGTQKMMSPGCDCLYLCLCVSLRRPKSLTLPNAPKNVTRGMLSRLPIFVNVTDPATGRLIADGNDTWSYEYYTEYLRRGETRQRRKSCTWPGWPAPAVLGPISSVTNCSTVIHPGEPRPRGHPLGTHAPSPAACRMSAELV